MCGGSNVASLTLKRLHYRYPGATEDTLRDLSLSVADGEAHALLGASGSGKTTLLNLLSGLLQPTIGELRLDDQEVSGIDGRARGVAQVFQFPVLYESMSVADNLGFPLKVRGESRATVRERVAHIAASLELESVLDRKPRGLSLYQRQLVAVGKSLVRPQVPLVLLDEPLTAVEPQVKWRLRQALRGLQRETGATMIYVTHDQTEALTFADRVSVLVDGRILQTGTPHEIYAQPQHEFIGHFVGSPGMNFLPAAVLQRRDCERVGFRPEWAILGNQGQLAVRVKRVRMQGTQHGVPVGLVTVDSEFGEIALRGPCELTVGQGCQLHINRHVGFSAGVIVDSTSGSSRANDVGMRV